MNGVTTYGYDALSRKTYELEADGTSKQYWCYDGTADPAHPQSNCHSNGSSFTSGTWVDHSDEVGNNWQHVSDAEARLRAVIEPYSYETDYLYDGFSDLKQVDQWGGAHGSATDHQRLFSYDALSRLTSATNPETGTVGYGYDADSNVVTKTDARGVTTTYSYDPLNRLVGKSYAGDAAATPWSCYQYDGASTANQVGRIINEWTQSAAIGACATIAPTTGFLSKRSFLLYDPMGRIKSEWQYTLANSGGTPYKPMYTYDLAGNLLTSTDGTTPSPTTSGATLTFAYTRDQASHLLTVSSNWSDSVHPASLFSAQTGLTPSPCGTTYSSTTPYAAFGGLMNATLGSSITLNRGYYTRLWMECEIDGSAGAAAATSGSATIGITGNEQIK